MVPVLAPSLGQLILWLAPWRSIFLIFGAYAAAVFLWVLLRLPETLHPEYRLTLTRDHIVHAAALVLGNRTSLWYTLAVTVLFGSILAYVGMVQQIFEYAFHRASLMPTMFALCASSMGVTAFLNSRIVERVGMRIISHLGLLAFITITGVRPWPALASRHRTSAPWRWSRWARWPASVPRCRDSSAPLAARWWARSSGGNSTARPCRWPAVHSPAACRACCSYCWRSRGACSGRIMPAPRRSRCVAPA